MSEHRGALTAEGELYPSPRRALDYLETDPPEPGRAIEIGAGLRWGRIPLPMELNHINVWLLRHEDGWMLVDTGLADDVCRAAWHSLETHDLEGRALRRIFITHDHPDHMGLARWLHERHGAPVWMSAIGHSSTGGYLAASPDALRAGQLEFFTAHGMEVELETLRKAAGREHGAWYGGLPPLAQAAAGGQRVHAAGRDWDIIETSGHCRGHLCLYDAQAPILIAGDQVLPAISPAPDIVQAEFQRPRPKRRAAGNLAHGTVRLDDRQQAAPARRAAPSCPCAAGAPPRRQPRHRSLHRPRRRARRRRHGGRMADR